MTRKQGPGYKFEPWQYLGNILQRRVDAEIVARAGFPAQAVERLQADSRELQRKHLDFTSKAGQKVASRLDLLAARQRAKNFRLVALAVGRNVLDDDLEASAELEKYAGRSPTPERLIQQIDGLLGMARRYEQKFRAMGAEDTFFAEGAAAR